MCFRLNVRYIATTTTRTTTKTSTATAATTRTTAASWLFLLTLISMQHNRLSQDCCQGAALQMQHQQQQQQQQQEKEITLQQEQPSFYQDFSRIAINSKVPALLQLPTPSEHVRTSHKSDENKVTNTQATSTTSITTKATRIKPTTKVKNTAIFAENIAANSDNVRNLDEIEADFLNDAPANSAGSRSSKALQQPFLAWDNPETLLRRRHIVPEKLQYTQEIIIKQGRLVGIIRHMQPQTGLHDVSQYLGLPYAEAPVGSRRFMPPGTPLPWQGLKTARHLPPVCPQKLPDTSKQGGAKMSRGRYKQLTRLLPYLKSENEDCLYLNIYVPRADDLEQKPTYPVLVYIHGESFEWNSGNAYDGSVLASYGEIIVVTVNYRLGVLGFMKPSINERTVANFGLLDQIAALHWIKENIAKFGGDHERVTLMGHSTGAACVNYLMVSPVASGLFHRAILMSGSAMSDWAASNHSLQLTMQIAHSLDCPLIDDNDEMIDCLRGKRYQDILKISTSFPQFSTSLGPIVDGHVIPNQPYKVMGQYTELFSRYDLLFGITESESYHTLGALALEEGLRENERDNLLRFYMQSRYDVRPDLALAATLKKYTDMYNNPIKATNMEHRDVVLDILSDARIVGPLMQTGLFHADVNQHNYMYVFGHNSAAGPHASLPHSIAGEELAFVFGAPLAPSGPFQNSYSTQEKLLSEAVMSYWTNFAKTGNPKAPWKGTFINLHAMEWERYDLDWPEFNKRSQAYINIGIPPSIGYKYRQIYMSFWNKELPDELNQIATMQQQPFLHSYNNAQIPRGGTSNANVNFYPPRGAAGGEVITGHMSKYGNRDGGAEDPVRTLKLLLQEPYGKSTTTIDAEAAAAAENMYNAPPTFGVAKQQSEDELYSGLVTVPTSPAVWGVISSGATTTAATEPLVVPNLSDTEQEVAKSESTMHLLIGLVVVFIVLNVAIYVTFLLQKRRKKSAHSVMRKLGGAGGILSYDGNTDDELKRSKHTTHDADDNSYILDIVRKSNTYEAVKTERSPINGYKMTRQLSCSTVDTHTKVCEWMAGGGGAGGGSKLCEGIGNTLNRLNCNNISKISKHSSSSPTFSTLRGGSSGGGSFQQQRSHKISVAIDATPQTRSQSVLGQQPIELSKQQQLYDGRNRIICQEVEVEDQELLMPQQILDTTYSGAAEMLMRQHSAATEPCDYELPQQQEELLPIFHKHSRSDPVELIYELHKQDEQVTSFIQAPDINVTSRDDDDVKPGQPLSAAEQLSLIQRRNYPKVLPTLHKRNSLPPNGLLLQQIMACGGKQPPPMPPPRTISTLGRKSSLLDRRSSGAITTSPVMLAQDSTVDEEEEPLQIEENTLIVGPIVPKTDYSLSLLRRSKKDSKDMQPSQQVSEASTASAAMPSNPQPLHVPVFSFESCQLPRHTQLLPAGAHHTEAIYAIEPLNLAASLPCMPAITPTTPLSPANFHTAPSTPLDSTTNGPIYAQSSKCGWMKGNNNSNNTIVAGKSQIPRILPGSGQQEVAISTTTTTTASSSTNTNVTMAGNQLQTTTTTTTTTGATTNNTTTTTSATAAASRIPQLNRSLNTFQQQQQQPQQQQQQHQISKDQSTSVVCDKTAATTTTTSPISPPTTTTTTMPIMTMPTSTTTNLQNQPPITSSCLSAATAAGSSNSFSSLTASQKSSLRASSSSSGSGISSSSSASSSSTGTVRTELQQRQ